MQPVISSSKFSGFLVGPVDHVIKQQQIFVNGTKFELVVYQYNDCTLSLVLEWDPERKLPFYLDMAETCKREMTLLDPILNSDHAEISKTNRYL